jgi:P4 family phage/plasmid primase-like protien
MSTPPVNERSGPRLGTASTLNQSHPQDATNAADGKAIAATSSPKIGFYRSAREPEQYDTTTLEDFIDAIKSDEYKAKITKLRSTLAAGDDDGYAVAKRSLQAVSISGSVHDNGLRAKAMEEGRFTHSGFLQLDFDAADNIGWEGHKIVEHLAADSRVVAAFASPSGHGVKGIARIAVCKTKEEHVACFAAARNVWKGRNLIIDESCKDPVRLMFVSHDPQAWLDLKRTDVFEPGRDAQDAPQPLAKKKANTDNHQRLILRSPAFPEPPHEGIHTWLMEAAWHCRSVDMSEADTVAKLQSYDGKLRRALQPAEAVDAARQVFSAVRQSHGTRSTIARYREAFIPADLPDLTRFGESDADNALRVHAVAGGNFHHVADSGQWLIWDGFRWTPDRDGKMVRLFLNVMEGAASQGIGMENRKAGEALVKHAMRCRDNAKVTSGLTMLKSVQGVTISANDLDADPWVIGTPSGLIDLRAGKTITPDRRLLVTKSIACDYDPDATCPTWEDVIHTATAGDDELIRFLQCSIGYTLTGSTREQCLLFLYGLGANSKGTVVETVKSLLGDYAITAPESLFTVDRNSSATNDIARLAGCRMACASELDENTAFAESRIKSLTGGDTITARFLHREFFDFRPSHKFWISGNHKPTVKGTDDGIWRRMRLVPFVVTIPPEKRDLNLGDKLRTELPGILRWAIEGCLIWQREGLNTPRCVTQATADYRASEDVVGQFLEDATTTDQDDQVLKSSLFESYAGWAEKHGIKRPLTATALNRKLEERGFEQKKIKGGRYWRGISLL